MRLRVLISALCMGLTPAISIAAEPLPAPVEVMIVGTYHMSNPGHDLHDLKADDVLSPRRQSEIAALTDALARFKPTKVAVEWPEAIVAERYAKYGTGSLPPSRNEVVQLGFRLAKMAGAQGVFGIDVDGEFPYDAVKAYASTHSLVGLLDEQNTAVEHDIARQQRTLGEKGISGALRYLNDPARLKDDNAFYRTMLRVGDGATQPGVDLLTAWYRRNFLICANLIQLSSPGDRIVVIYGAGHGFLLRQCVSETPGFKLVEANDYLPN